MNGRLIWQHVKVISRCSSTASLMVARVMKKSRASSCSWRTPRLSSISFRQSETFARDGKEAAMQAACGGHVDILKYFVEERKISDELKIDCCGNRCKVWPTRLPQILSRRGESASERLAIHRLGSVSRAPRLRKLLARKRVSRTNGRRIRSICQTNERTAVEHEQSSTGKNYRTHTHTHFFNTNE